MVNFDMLNHSKYIQNLIHFAKSNSEYMTYAASIVNAEGDTLVEVLAQPEDSPTFHGEMVAINECARRFPNIDWSSLTLYSTAEPCPMCATASCWAQLGCVVYAADIPFTERLWQGHDIMKIATFQRCADIFDNVPNAPKLVAGIETALAETFFIERQGRFAAAHREKVWDAF